MHKQRLIGFALAAFLGAAQVYATGLPAAETAPASQTSNQGGVTVTVSPRGFRTETWDFGVTLESHTQSLDDDLVRSSTLLSDGKPSAPLGWEGAAPGGHHRKGVLRFKAVGPPPQAVELQIRRAGEADPRTFRWRLK